MNKATAPAASLPGLFCINIPDKPASFLADQGFVLIRKRSNGIHRCASPPGKGFVLRCDFLFDAKQARTHLPCSELAFPAAKRTSTGSDSLRKRETLRAETERTNPIGNKPGIHGVKNFGDGCPLHRMRYAAVAPKSALLESTASESAFT